MKLLLTGAFNYTKKQFEKINKIKYETTFIQDEREVLEIDLNEFEVVVCNDLFTYNDIRSFNNLKAIQLTSAGFDRVPVDYINEKNIKLFNAKDVYSIPMAEWTILKILEIYKDSTFFYENQKNNQWKKNRKLLELTDKNVGIIGFGSVGLEIAKRLKAFNTYTIAINRNENKSEYIDKYIPLNQLDEILPKLDIVILTVALTEGTKHLITQNEIDLMKDHSILINVARGGLINESDLIYALQNDKFRGVALDVFEEEPLLKSPLWNLENVLITPHNSFVSEQNNDRLFNVILENLTNVRGVS